MALTYSEKIPLGAPAPNFELLGVDGNRYGLSSFDSAKGLIVVFMCNHCPYVIAVQDRINDLYREFAPKDFPLVGINSNDAVKYPDDSYEAMKTRALEKDYEFPYLFDETQKVAQDYGAVCTPDPFVFERKDGEFLLRYHGRIDDSWKDPSAITKRDLADAVNAVLDARPVPAEQVPAMGCSIKWK